MVFGKVYNNKICRRVIPLSLHHDHGNIICHLNPNQFKIRNIIGYRDRFHPM